MSQNLLNSHVKERRTTQQRFALRTYETLTGSKHDPFYLYCLSLLKETATLNFPNFLMNEHRTPQHKTTQRIYMGYHGISWEVNSTTSLSIISYT